MNADYLKKTHSGKQRDILPEKDMDGRDLANDSNGFCICPNCFHLVFDEMLTGVCQFCQYQFCPSVPLKGTSNNSFCRSKTINRATLKKSNDHQGL